MKQMWEWVRNMINIENNDSNMNNVLSTIVRH